MCVLTTIAEGSVSVMCVGVPSVVVAESLPCSNYSDYDLVQRVQMQELEVRGGQQPSLTLWSHQNHRSAVFSKHRRTFI